MAPSMVVKSDEENCIKECQKVCIPFSISSSISSHTIRYNLSNEDNKYSEGYNATQVMKEYTFSAKYVELKKPVLCHCKRGGGCYKTLGAIST